MATMKTLNGYGFNATELNGKTSDNYLKKTDTASDSEKLGGKAPKYYLQPRNLLDNSDFTNPVNQRGKTSYAEVGYTIDRWRNDYADNLSITSGGIHLTKSSEISMFIQYLSDEAWNTLKGKAFTIAASTDDGSICVSTGTMPVGTDGVDSVQTNLGSSGYLFNLYKTDNGRPMARIFSLDQGAEVTLRWVALYEGTYTRDTLPPYVPKGYAAELAECQRYYLQFGDDCTSNGYVGSDGKSLWLSIPTPVTMRALPNLIKSNALEARSLAGRAEIHNYTVIYRNAFANNVLMGISQDEHEFPASTPISVFFALGGSPGLDANF